MKAYCENCEALSPASFRAGKDSVDGRDYEDICCDQCHFIIATIAERPHELKLLAENIVKAAVERFKVDEIDDDWPPGSLDEAEARLARAWDEFNRALPDTAAASSPSPEQQGSGNTNGMKGSGNG